MKKQTGISRCDRNFEFYIKWLEKGNLPYKILDYNLNNFEDVKDCSSLLLTGGNEDIYPEFYMDWDESKDRSKFKPQRDGFEFRLLDYAFDSNLPVLGICRGMQLLNCKLNGNLINDIQTVRNTVHTKINENEDRIHEVNVSDDSMLYNIIKQKKGKVNSSHHQGVDRLGEGLKATAKADDGIIEALEWSDNTSKPFMLAIQWHPERMIDQNSPFTKNVLRKFKEVTQSL